MVGEVTISVKDASSNKYIANVNTNIQPDLKGVACPGTDGAGPYNFELHMPANSNVLNSEGFIIDG